MLYDNNIIARPFKIKISALMGICVILSLLFFCPILKATNFTGPIELSSQEFNELNINGAANLNKTTADTLTVEGPLNFSQLKVKEGAEISGPCYGEDGDFSTLTVHGTFWGSKVNITNLTVDDEVTIEDFKINGNATIKGPLKAKNGSFKDINAVQTPVALYNVEVNNITVKKAAIKDSKDTTNASSNPQNNEIKLAGNTIVSGNITFESGDGTVFIRDKTAQLKGTVIGGKIRE